jgi:RNA recognition motif-containing protein
VIITTFIFFLISFPPSAPFYASSFAHIETTMFALRRVAVRAFQFQPTRQLTTIRPFVSPIHQQIPSTLRALHQSRIFAEEQKTSPEEEQTEIKEDDATPDLKERVQNAAESAKETVANVAQAAFGGGVSPSANVFPSENPSPAATRSTILYVGNLLFEATPNDLEKTFSPYGVITNKRVVTDPSGRSKGFGYVEFANQEDADKAVRELDQEELAGRRMAVQYHIPRQNRLPRGDLSKSRTKNPPSSTLFIGNMSYQMSDKDLHGKLGMTS